MEVKSTFPNMFLSSGTNNDTPPDANMVMEIKSTYSSLAEQIRDIWEAAEKGSVHYQVLAERIETMIYYFYIKLMIDRTEMNDLLNVNRRCFKEIKIRGRRSKQL